MEEVVVVLVVVRRSRAGGGERSSTRTARCGGRLRLSCYMRVRDELVRLVGSSLPPVGSPPPPVGSLLPFRPGQG